MKEQSLETSKVGKSEKQSQQQVDKSNSQVQKSRQVTLGNRLQRQISKRLGQSWAGRQKNNAQKSRITQKMIWSWISQRLEPWYRCRLANELPVWLTNGCSAGEAVRSGKTQVADQQLWEFLSVLKSQSCLEKGGKCSQGPEWWWVGN